LEVSLRISHPSENLFLWHSNLHDGMEREFKNSLQHLLCIAGACYC